MTLEPQFGNVLATTTFHVTPADITATYRSYVFWSATKPSTWLLVAAVIALLTLADIIWFGTSGYLTLVPGAAIFVWVLIYYVGLYLAMPLLARRSIAKQKNLKQEWRVDFTENGLRAVTPTQDIFVSWSDFVGWSQNSQTFIIYQSDRLMRYMPLRALTPEMLAIITSKLHSVPRR
ncbi:YcxB family protein [Phyllobacterium sp. P30BS-XVII]|uniref:YcxB family protein n=1 Tax=Phyllobacterium sp. P30BS-XVII TaxID=2587046 RepID=UPI0015FD8453|nr:YcxB family protein [Phyllobacterium sp. P30BS-XVII]MBA8902314.1 hypothetical protein [Phyllobacterium sp. P30BS-XVII]